MYTYVVCTDRSKIENFSKPNGLEIVFGGTCGKYSISLKNYVAEITIKFTRLAYLIMTYFIKMYLKNWYELRE